jgi:chromosome segregation ATPase
MKESLEVLDLALLNIEKLWAGLRAHRQLCGDISNFEEQATKARADAEAAKRSLADLQTQVMAAQTELDKLRSERAAVEEQVAALRSERAELDSAIARIRALLKDAA